MEAALLYDWVTRLATPPSFRSLAKVESYLIKALYSSISLKGYFSSHDGHQGDPKAIYALEVSGGSTNVYHQAVFSKTSGQHDDEWCKPDWDGWQGRGLEAALVAQEAERYKRALFRLLADIQSGSEDQLCDILATQTKVSETGEGKSTPSRQPYQLNARPSPECSVIPATQSVNRLESYPLIAVVVPAPLWMREGVTRSTISAAVARCKKRLRSSRDADDPQDPELLIPGATQQRPRKNQNQWPSLFVIHWAAQTQPYTSDENALLVRLKEREGMLWAEIAAYFPERSASSLQVHYSTKLRHKATPRAEKLRIRR
ncbi:SANT/Myb-like DNA-binding domain-containing protein [Aspergillus fumigatus Af293]|uniref:MYB DNA binding domain protein n=1 Tax=Aspergillus fumigatus (strain ATCC MYA-4609 / CBS 101355 / FGSC A1100 / Af293) TaxID=330879 RepID=Q4WFC8_ASPFU|nr:MYB DNA binding domain protein [Aspergillus fumigatus Af293]EAL86549.1 MYB DNA binding domain protein [Aspergillus fumigatus Af293]